MCKFKLYTPIFFFCLPQCHPYHHGAKALILGDAAHAMVPYYGQGLNAGMEDCTLLMSLFNQPNLSTAEILEQFTELRWRDAHAICDLAMYNYVEVRKIYLNFPF